jgi:hypothetical protein
MMTERVLPWAAGGLAFLVTLAVLHGGPFAPTGSPLFEFGVEFPGGATSPDAAPLTVAVPRPVGLSGWYNGDALLLTALRLRNTGDRPVRVALELQLCDLPVAWLPLGNGWDRLHRSTKAPIAPSASFRMDWAVTFPAAARTKLEICDGALLLRDAERGTLLVRQPILLRREAGQP